MICGCPTYDQPPMRWLACPPVLGGKTQLCSCIQLNRPKEATDQNHSCCIRDAGKRQTPLKYVGAAKLSKVTLLTVISSALVSVQYLLFRNVAPRCQGFLQHRPRPLSHTSRDTQTSSRCLNTTDAQISWRSEATLAEEILRDEGSDTPLSAFLWRRRHVCCTVVIFWLNDA